MPSLVQFSDALNNLEKSKLAREELKLADSAETAEPNAKDATADDDAGRGVEDKVRMRIATITALAEEMRRRRVREDKLDVNGSKIKQGTYFFIIVNTENGEFYCSCQNNEIDFLFWRFMIRY